MEYPKMLYRRGKIKGASPVLFKDDIFCAVAVDAVEEEIMRAEAGFVASIADLDKPTPTPEPMSVVLDRAALVVEAESLGVPIGRKSAERLQADIEAKRVNG